MKILLLSLFLINQLAYAHTASIMSYNVENLFDTVHDEGKEDWEYLPKDTAGKKEACLKESSKHRRQDCLEADWTEKRLQIKLDQIAEVVKSAEPALPDFLGLVEVENKNVVQMLAKKLGYTELEITESPDNRGVDVALLYKSSALIKKLSRNEIIVPVEFPTRNILEVRFQTGNLTTTLFVNHWPSLHNPDASRVKAAEVLRKRVEEILKSSPDERIFIMGDFNTIDSNDPHPFKTVLYKDELLKDVYGSVMENSNIKEEHKKKIGSGTYYFAPKDDWNMLDHFFVNKNVLTDKNALEILNSFQIFNTPAMQKELKKKVYTDKEKAIKIVLAPRRFNPGANSKEEMGYSDHFPILMKMYFDDLPKEVKKEVKSKKKKAKK